jgi:GT2 family glycosyltransferase
VIAVVTTVRDGERALTGLAAALAAQTHRDFEWIVIDNGSRDRTAEVARAHGAIVVAEPRPGRSRARNSGVAATDASLLAFTDADCRPRRDWLARLGACLATGAPLVAGRIVMTTSPRPSAIERFDSLWRFREDPQRTWGPTENLAIRRDGFEEIGGFDLAFHRSGEDVDLCLRARAAGFPLAHCREAVVEHPSERELGPVLRRAFEHAWSLEPLHRRHGLTPGRYWRNPGPALRGDWALRRFGIDPAALSEHERRAVLRVARQDYAARIAGSLWAPLRPHSTRFRSDG